MQKRKNYRVAIDTNILVSSLMGKEVSRLNHVLADGNVTVVFSRESWKEFFAVIKRPKLKHYFSKDKVTSLVSILTHISELVTVESKISVCRDEKDNFLLELAKDSKADYLITGDKDLLVLEKFAHTRIVTFTQFLDLINT